MTAGARVRLTGSITVALPPDEAFVLFTPNGERAWAHGWAPEFPSPVADDTEPGTAFLTRHGERTVIWTVAGREPGRSIRYVSTIPGHRTGLITVTCEAAGHARPGARTKAGHPEQAVREAGHTAAARTGAGRGVGAGGHTEVTVSYDLTALDPAANAELGRFAEDYPRFLASWEHALANLIKTTGNQ
jgi:hypothetical protein